MILRAVTILLSVGALAAMWFGYDELNIFRRTVFWEYRYLIFVVVAFLVLSFLEWGIGWIKSKVEGEEH